MRTTNFNTRLAHTAAQSDVHLAHLLRGYIFFANRLERSAADQTCGKIERGHLEVLCTTLDHQISQHLG